MNNAKPFIKWAGGKNELIPSIIKYIPKQFNNYHEPFLGGGALFWYLLSNNYLDDRFVRITDINCMLINTYCQIKENPHDLLAQLKEYQWNYDNKPQSRRELYYEIRDKYNDPLYPNKFKAGHFIFLNKTCYNGLYRENKNGEFNVPMGKYDNPKIYDPEAILTCHHFMNELNNLEICTDTFIETINIAKSGDLIYLDPPYLPISSNSNFTNYSFHGFNLENHIKLHDICLKLQNKKCNVIISNSNHPEIINLYKNNFDINEVECSRSINSKIDSRHSIKELIITSII